jgi:phage-related tail fiber protein
LAYASKIEAEAGSDNSTTMTPLRVAQAIAALSFGLPSGSVIASGSQTTPGGYLLCNGAAISRTTYADLFAAIGTAFGAGDGSATFNIPDLRGEFLRGWDNSRGIDSGRAFGSLQYGSLLYASAQPGYAGNRSWVRNWVNFPSVSDLHWDSAGLGSTTAHGTYAQGRGGDGAGGYPGFSGASRPRNIAVNFYIKYQEAQI